MAPANRPKTAGFDSLLAPTVPSGVRPSGMWVGMEAPRQELSVGGFSKSVDRP